jgi:hypothetical protein
MDVSRARCGAEQIAFVCFKHLFVAHSQLTVPVEEVYSIRLELLAYCIRSKQPYSVWAHRESPRGHLHLLS